MKRKGFVKENNYNEIIGNNIRYERILRDFSIEELAELLDIDSNTLNRIEQGYEDISITDLCKISKFFSITMESLVCIYPTGDLVLKEMTEKERREITATCLIENLNYEELDFIIKIINSLKKLRTDFKDN